MNPFESFPQETPKRAFDDLRKESEERRRSEVERARHEGEKEDALPDEGADTKPEIFIGDLPERARNEGASAPEESGIRNVQDAPVSWTEFGEKDTPVTETDVAKVWAEPTPNTDMWLEPDDEPHGMVTPEEEAEEDAWERKKKSL